MEEGRKLNVEYRLPYNRAAYPGIAQYQLEMNRRDIGARMYMEILEVGGFAAVKIEENEFPINGEANYLDGTPVRLTATVTPIQTHPVYYEADLPYPKSTLWADIWKLIWNKLTSTK